ncbi:MAG: transporter substrate-binding domain-containing protein [Desulfobacterales bacterium]|nr:transporter substrate-binding domain-containing protein [Desulfobacterales bacterium]
MLRWKIGIILSLILLFTNSVFSQTDKITKIRIATPSWEKQTSRDGTGLFFDIIREVYEPVGIKMEYDFVPWKRALKEVRLKKADAMLGVLLDDAKEQNQIIPKYPMVTEYTTVVFKKGKIEKWEGVETLRGMHAIWIRGYNYHTSPQLKNLGLKWNEVDTYTGAWNLLARDRVDIYIDALHDIEQYIKVNNIDMNIYRREVLWGENSYIGFSKTERSEKLLKIYDKRIIELFRTNKLKEMHEKWGAKYLPEPWAE